MDRVPEELWTEVRDTVQEAVIKAIPEKKKYKKPNGCLRRPYKELRKEEKIKAYISSLVNLFDPVIKL